MGVPSVEVESGRPRAWRSSWTMPPYHRFIDPPMPAAPSASCWHRITQPPPPPPPAPGPSALISPTFSHRLSGDRSAFLRISSCCMLNTDHQYRSEPLGVFSYQLLTWSPTTASTIGVVSLNVLPISCL